MNKDKGSNETLMRREIGEIPVALDRLLRSVTESIEPAAARLRDAPPRFITTIARGSSDHCATYLKYAFEITAGLPVASLGPSVASIYGAKLQLADSLGIAISQSGKSPDIVESTRMCRSGGALTMAITNEPASPLADAADHTLNIQAGAEKSVAATKTFVCSVVAGLLLLAHWREDTDLLAALNALPNQCAQAADCRWTPLLERMTASESVYVLGRGPTFAIAHEMALKFKETCQVHAEAYSAAEVMHGPVSIVGKDFPIVMLSARDASAPSVSDAAKKLADKGAEVFMTSGPTSGARKLDTIASGHPLTEPLLLVVSFYAFIEELARLHGRNPDMPPNLQKVTETV